jgi:transcription elongation factor Elf1
MQMAEQRKEFKEGEECCPRCGSEDVDYDEAPAHAKCNSCGQEFEIRTVAIWNE